MALLDTDEQQFLSFYMGDHVFGIPIFQVQDILHTQQLTHVPLAADFIEGIMNLRGRIVTAINFRKRLHYSEVGGSNTMSIVLEHKDELFSLIVDDVGEVLNLSTDKIEVPPYTLNPAWREVATGVFQLQDKIMILLNPHALLQINGGQK